MVVVQVNVGVDQEAAGRHDESLAGSGRPLYVLTGFLGSGKTTVLSRLLRDAEAGTAVLVNEVGEVGIDQHLVEHLSDEVAVLESGCVCCSLRDDIAEALERVDRVAEAAGRPVARFVLETTGVADPGALVGAFTRDPRLARTAELAGVIAVLDASRALSLLDEHPEVAHQLELADRVVLTKRDLAAPRAPDLVEALMDDRYPGRPRTWSAEGHLDPDFFWSSRRRIEAPGWVESLHLHGPNVDLRTIELQGPVDVQALALWHRIVVGWDGRCLLRIKGIVEAADGHWVLESAQFAVFPPRRLEARPRGWSGSRLTVASRGLPASVLDRLEDAAFSAARGEPASS